MYAHVQNAAKQIDLEPAKKIKASTSAQAHPLTQLQPLIGNRGVAMFAGSESAAQRKSNASEETEEKRENRTGMPDPLKNGLEKLSGLDLSDVKVHYNSDKPGQLQALAYAQGTDIHIAPGQEAHLPHEAWHVVQQKQGRVKPTTSLGDVAINDDVALEAEADKMGAKALQMKTNQVVQRQQTEVYVKNITGSYTDDSGNTQNFTFDGEHHVETTKSHPKGKKDYKDKVIALLKKNGVIPKTIANDQIDVDYDQFGRKK